MLDVSTSSMLHSFAEEQTAFGSPGHKVAGLSCCMARLDLSDDLLLPGGPISSSVCRQSALNLPDLSCLLTSGLSSLWLAVSGQRYLQHTARCLHHCLVPVARPDLIVHAQVITV